MCDLKHCCEEDLPQPVIDSFLFGCELSSKVKQYTFEVDEEDECEHSLALHTISLGAGSKDEFNVVEAVGRNYENKEIAVQIANLKLSCLLSVNLEQFEIQPPVTFRLTSGSGPILIAGRHIIASSDEQDSLSGEEEDEEDTEEEGESEEDDEDEDEDIVPIKPANKKMRV
ncbi:nucleoplasmin-3 [Pelodytes ibericus]